MYELNKKICNQLNLDFLYENADYIQKTLYYKELYGKKVSCVGKLDYDNKTYWAVNGSEDGEKSHIDLLKKLLEEQGIKNPEIVNIDDTKMNCIYNKNGKWEMVSLEQYKKDHPDSKSRNNRLFSCCERKLLTKLSQNVKSGDMYVAFQPCSICSYSFEYYKSVAGYSINVHCPDPLSWIDDLE